MEFAVALQAQALSPGLAERDFVLLGGTELPVGSRSVRLGPAELPGADPFALTGRVRSRRRPWTRYPSARCRKAAIWPLVTFDVGQKRSFTGGLQPLVTPAVASLSMSASKIESSSSTNRSPLPWSV